MSRVNAKSGVAIQIAKNHKKQLTFCPSCGKIKLIFVWPMAITLHFNDHCEKTLDFCAIYDSSDFIFYVKWLFPPFWAAARYPLQFNLSV